MKKTKTPTGTTTTTTTTPAPTTTPTTKNSGGNRRGGTSVANTPGLGTSMGSRGRVSAPTAEADVRAQQYANLAKLYRQTFQTPIQQTRKAIGKAQITDEANRAKNEGWQQAIGGVAALALLPSGSGNEAGRYEDKLQNLMQRKDNTLPLLRKLTNFAGAQGFAPEDTQQALQTYLQQEQALSQFMPRHYRAPNKQDLLGAVNNYAPQYQQKREQEQQINDMIPYIAMIRDSMLATADSDYQYMQDKASTIKDPEKQAQALATADNIYRLKLMYADSIASNPASNDPSSLMSILGAANAGQTKNINNLYGGAGNTPEAQAGSGSSQAIDENFIAQILGEQ